MKIFIAGHKGMVGSSILKKLINKTDVEIHTSEKATLNLLDQTRVSKYFSYHNFDLVIDCAAKVGGIHSNNIYQGNRYVLFDAIPTFDYASQKIVIADENFDISTIQVTVTELLDESAVIEQVWTPVQNVGYTSRTDENIYF